MVGLADIAALPTIVQINGKTIEVRPVSLRSLAGLLDRYPEVGRLMSTENASITPATIMRTAAHAIPAIIAAGVGRYGDEKAEDEADALDLETQIDLLGAILERTIGSKGFDPFVEKLKGIGVRLGVEKLPGMPAQATPSPPLSIAS